MSNTTNIFEKASRRQLRFESTKGELTVEQLWELPLTSATRVNLDALAQAVNRELKSLDEESFVQKTSNPRKTTLQLKLDILKHIIATRVAEQDAAEQAQTKKAEREKLQEILAAKQDAALENLTVEELEARLASLS